MPATPWWSCAQICCKLGLLGESSPSADHVALRTEPFIRAVAARHAQREDAEAGRHTRTQGLLFDDCFACCAVLQEEELGQAGKPRSSNNTHGHAACISRLSRHVVQKIASASLSLLNQVLVLLIWALVKIIFEMSLKSKVVLAFVTEGPGSTTSAALSPKHRQPGGLAVGLLQERLFELIMT